MSLILWIWHLDGYLRYCLLLFKEGVIILKQQTLKPLNFKPLNFKHTPT